MDTIVQNYLNEYSITEQSRNFMNTAQLMYIMVSLKILPAENTPLSILYFAKLCHQSGLPKGVLNIVAEYGNEAGDALSSHTGINELSFTGSTNVVKIVGRNALENMSRMTLKLGGKSPMLVFKTTTHMNT